MSIKQRLRFARDALAVNRSGLFDAGWYRLRYPEAEAAGVHPAVHFLTQGWRTGCDPGPGFNCRWYLEQNPNVWASGINPLLHYLRGGAAEGRLPLPDRADEFISSGAGTFSSRQLLRDVPLIIRSFFTTDLANLLTDAKAVVPAPRYLRGCVDARPEGITVLVCAHASGRQLFGAERSLLTVLEAMNNLGFNVITTLPTPNPEYEASAARFSQGVYVFTYPQWSKDFPENAEVVAAFEKIIAECGVDFVHVNTIMPREVLTAARRLDKVSIVHARELISEDEDLADAIGESPSSVASMVLERADFIIANSTATAECYGGSERVFVVRNSVAVDQLDIANTVEQSAVCIALIGSNTRKKGVEDFLELSRLLQGRVSNVKLLVIGARPEIDETRWNERPDNLAYTGYLPSSEEAIARANIVVNLSHVPESFGRTVAEAMWSE